MYIHVHWILKINPILYIIEKNYKYIQYNKNFVHFMYSKIINLKSISFLENDINRITTHICSEVMFINMIYNLYQSYIKL